MTRVSLPLVGAVALVLLTTTAGAASRDVSTTRPWTRWWWPGSGVDEANITRELEAFAAAGLGGVEITPIYGAKGYEERYVEFLTPRWMELLAHTGREAQRLGLGVDMATGTGWPFGGPWVAEEDGSAKLAFLDGKLGGTPTNMQVKRAAPGGEGRVIDPYSPAALRRYLAPFDRAFANFPRELVRAQFHDSFEYYESGWTGQLVDTFREMHGYDLQDYAAALAGPVAGRGEAGPGSPTPATIDEDTLRRVKSDYRATLAKLHLDYLQAWITWSHDHGWIVRNQSHGAPANLLDLYGAVDIPETETFGSTPFPIPGLRRDPADVRSDQDLPDSLVIRMASSAAHVMGRPLASSETCTWLREHWKVALSFTKPEIDRLFVDGINHILYHGTCYSPADAPWPGWLFYASTQFNDRNPWWGDFTALNAYVHEVQTVLQESSPDNDVLLYWPFHDVLESQDGLMQQYGVHHIDWLRDSPCGRLAQQLIDQGFSWDYISDAQLVASHAKEGGIQTPGEDYRVIVVPATRRMPVETLARLREFAAQGVPVLFEALPDDVPGFGQLEKRRTEFAAHRDALVRAGTITGDIVPRLVQQRVTREPLVETGLRFIRRARPDGRSYFMTNLTNRAIDQWVRLGVEAHGAIRVEPITGFTASVPLRTGSHGATEAYLQIVPGESVVLHTSGRAEGPSPSALRPADEARTLNGSWDITFLRGGPDLPASARSTDLASWTELPGEATKSFAGTARYRIEFMLPADVTADDWMLDLGDVRESAVVRVNGHEVATLWSLPFRVRIGDHVKAGTNVLELDVTNLAANRIRDLDRRGVEWRIMREINFVNIRYRPFDASTWDLTPSGLLGPVTLQPLQRFDPASTP